MTRASTETVEPTSRSRSWVVPVVSAASVLILVVAVVAGVRWFHDHECQSAYNQDCPDGMGTSDVESGVLVLDLGSTRRDVAFVWSFSNTGESLRTVDWTAVALSDADQQTARCWGDDSEHEYLARPDQTEWAYAGCEFGQPPALPLTLSYDDEVAGRYDSVPPRPPKGSFP